MKILSIQNNTINNKFNLKRQEFRKTNKLNSLSNDSFTSFKGHYEPTKLELNKLPSPISSLARKIARNFNEKLEHKGNIAPLSLNDLQDISKNTSNNRLKKIAGKNSLFAEKLFADAIKQENKDLLEESTKVFEVALSTEKILKAKKFQPHETNNHILARTMDIARNYLILEQPEKAEKIVAENLKEAGTAKQKYADSLNVFITHLGLSYIGKGEVKKGVAYLQKSLTKFEDNYDRVEEKRTSFYLGDAYLKMGEYDKAIPKLELALEHYNNIKMHNMRAVTNSLIGECYLGKGEPEKAHKHFSKTCYLAKSKMEKAHSYKKMAEVYSELKQDEKAIAARAFAALSYLSSSTKNLNDDFMKEIQTAWKTDMIRLQESKFKQNASIVRFDSKQNTISQLQVFTKKHFTPEVQKG